MEVNVDWHHMDGSAMTGAVVLVSTDARGVATVTLNRPDVANAYNAEMLEALIAALTGLAADTAVRCLVIRGAGRHFPGRR